MTSMKCCCCHQTMLQGEIRMSETAPGQGQLEFFPDVSVGEISRRPLPSPASHCDSCQLTICPAIAQPRALQCPECESYLLAGEITLQASWDKRSVDAAWSLVVGARPITSGSLCFKHQTAMTELDPES